MFFFGRFFIFVIEGRPRFLPISRVLSTIFFILALINMWLMGRNSCPTQKHEVEKCLQRIWPLEITKIW